MKKNDRLRLTCDALGAELEGVCRTREGLPVFVPGMLPGETAEVVLTRVQPRFAFGRRVGELQSRSPQRRNDSCPAYPRCGGCNGRHMRYAATLAAKRDQVRACFDRIAKLAFDVPEVIGMAEPFHYRNKTALPVAGTADAPVVGFFAPRSHTVIPADDCLNAMVPSGAICGAFLGWVRDHRIDPYREEAHAGLLRHLVIRVNRKHEAMVTVVINGDTLPFADDLFERLKGHRVTSLGISINKDRTNVIFGRSFRTLFGSGVLTDELCGLRFELAAASFFQVNPTQTEVLYGCAKDFAALSGDELVADVYCGAGTISLMLAQAARQVIGIEIVPQAIDNARQNAKRNGIGNARFELGAAEQVLPALVAQGLRPDVVVVDPPRKGLDPAVIDAMAAAAPQRVVYVSCNVATQARDAALLAAKGYRLTRMQPVDMFCWTAGVENVAAFERC